MKDIPARYDPADTEEKIYDSWSEGHMFAADENTARTPYSIVIPPPNVTGILHMGHALNNTIQDILARWKRMQGFEVLWMPGTDHAGIATQNVVEREMAKKGLKRHDLTREEFIAKVWEWKEEYGNTIIRQLKRLGCSCDWDRTRFTMDHGLTEAVKESFLRLYNDGLLYKGDYMINWCPRCGTALSDEEAEHRDIDGMLYHIKYPVKGRDSLNEENVDYIVVATTRPETMLGDVAIAVNPEDQRYAHLRGKSIILPILKRELQVIFDDNVDPDFGTGALKVTPAHDPVDFELGIKHGLKSVNVMDPDGTINANGDIYAGMDRFECREVIIEDLKKRKLFAGASEHRHAVGHCYRCHVAVEPRLSKQWFVNTRPLARPAIEEVERGNIRFFPSRWTKVYLNWMKQIRPWCISRQIWWGHRIPVWYCKDCIGHQDIRDVDIKGPGVRGIYVGKEEPSKCPYCGGHDLEQDPDVLDTWFSSWLWPFSTMGWPEKTRTLDIFYPTASLVTAQEIIFFWVARMVMAGLKFCGDIPFRDVYIHGTVRDSTGTKMSKSLGNVIDPLDIIADVGSDALRFSLISITSQGQDVFLSKEKFEIGRNFANKIWNASRYVLLNLGEGEGEDLPEDDSMGIAEKWILHNLDITALRVTESLDKYRFNDAAGYLYDFIWHKYCDWYIEMSKLSEDKKVARKVLLLVLKRSLQLLHPVMPFITESIWKMIPGTESEWIIGAEWPRPENDITRKMSSEQMEKLILMITAIRNIRSFWNIDARTTIDVFFDAEDRSEISMIEENVLYFERLASGRVVHAGLNIERPEKSVAALVGRTKIFVPLGDAVNVEKEKKRVSEKILEIERFLSGIEKKLANRSFLDKAPPEVVEKERSKLKKFRREADNLKENLNALV